MRTLDDGVPGGVRTYADSAPATQRAEAVARFTSMAVVLVALGAFATLYGFLDPGRSHPSLKLGGAMAIAGMGVASLTLGRPVEPRAAKFPYRYRSALVEVHPLVLAVAWLSMASALVHFAVIKQHFGEYPLYGWFFAAVATGQLAWAILAVARPSRALLLAGTAANALVAATWVLTRTYGSVIGPDATTAAKVGFGDVVSTLFEAAVAVGCVVLIRSHLQRHGARSYRSEVLSVVVALGTTLLTALALFSAVGGRPFVSHVG